MSENNNLKLIPAIIQDHRTVNVLMLGYMNQESIDLTLKQKKFGFIAEVEINYGKKVKHLVIF